MNAFTYTSSLSPTEIAQLNEMGFPAEAIQRAFEKSLKEKRPVINILLESSETLTSPKEGKHRFEPLNPGQRTRVKGVPVGLKNVGNTCYFNSLIQSYYFNPRFVKEIFSFDFEAEIPREQLTPGDRSAKVKLLEASIRLIKEFQKLFASMTLSDQKYIDPSDVLSAIVDEYGNPIQIGDEKDVTELNFHILARIDEALCFQAKAKNKNPSLLDEEGGEKDLKDSKIIEIEEEDYNIMSSVRLLKKYTRFFEVRSSKTFFGKLKETISYQDSSKMEKHSEEVVLGPIILDIACKDLYSSWESFSHSVIDDFKLPNGVITKVNKSYWIITPPETLCFQLQRVGFNKSKGEIEKLNDVFRFEKEVFIDRFLIENEKTYSDNLSMIRNLQRKIEKVERKIELLNNYNRSGLSMGAILSMAKSIIQNRAGIELGKSDDSFDLLDISDLSMNSENLKPEGPGDKEVGTAAHVLSEFETETRKKLEKLTKELALYKGQYDSIYSNLKSAKYRLMGILMHEGKAQTGHYYSYLFNFERGVWMKFNDIHVTEEANEEKIFQEAYGMENKSAYFLIYISEKCLNAYSTAAPEFSDILGLNSPNNLLTNLPQGTEKRVYYDYLRQIPQALKKEVMKDNFQFEKSLKDFQFHNTAMQVIDNYQERFVFVNEFVRKHREKERQNNNNYLPPLLNFGTYIRDDQDPQDNNFKWHILDCALREASNGKITIHELEKERTIFEKLKEHFASMGTFKSPSKLFLTKQESSKLDVRFAEYIGKVQNREVLIHVMESLLQDRYPEALAASASMIDLTAPNSQSYFSRFIKEIIKICLLKTTVDSIALYQYPNKQKFCEYLKMVTRYGEFLPKNDLIILQFVNVFAELMSKNGGKNDETNDLIYVSLKHLKAGSAPKEYDASLAKLNEKIEEIQNNVIEKYPYLWKVKEKEDAVEKSYDSCLSRVFEKYKKFIEFMGKYYDSPRKPFSNEELVAFFFTKKN